MTGWQQGCKPSALHETKRRCGERLSRDVSRSIHSERTAWRLGQVKSNLHQGPSVQVRLEQVREVVHRAQDPTVVRGGYGDVGGRYPGQTRLRSPDEVEVEAARSAARTVDGAVERSPYFDTLITVPDGP